MKNRVGGDAIVVLHDFSVPNPLPQLRHSIGRVGGAVEKRQEKGIAFLLADFRKTRDIHLSRNAHIGIFQTREVVEMRFSRKAVHINIAERHRCIPFR